jgi:hypothetical protein
MNQSNMHGRTWVRVGRRASVNRSVCGLAFIMRVPERVIECVSRRSEGSTSRKVFTVCCVHRICTVSIRTLSRRFAEDQCE